MEIGGVAGASSIGLSVVIPARNAARFIGAQLEALTRQRSTEPWEVVVADNGSTDGTAAVAASFRTRFQNLRIVSAPHVRGAGHARNEGARAAAGELLAFVDADDIVGEGWVEAMTCAIPEHGFVASRFEYGRLNPDRENWIRNGPQVGALQTLHYPPHLPHAGGSGLGIRRELHEAVGGFDETLPFVQDTDYCLRIQQRGTALRLADGAVVHVRHRDNLRGLFRQSERWARYNTRLYTIHGADTAPPAGVWAVYARRWRILLRRATRIRTRHQLAIWFVQLGTQIGLLEGVIMYRVPPIIFPPL